MENPPEEIVQVVLRLTAASSPDIQKRVIEEYMAPDVAFRHPLCAVESGPDSRATVLGIYQVLSPHIELRLNSVVWDPEHNYLFLDVVQRFKLFFLPIKPAPARLCVRLTLNKGRNGLYYIAMQEDFYHPDEFMALLLPIFVPFIRIFLLVSGLASALYAKLAQLFGFWQTNKLSETRVYEGSDHSETGDLYSNSGDKADDDDFDD